jgi:uncharacterized protein YidB (DUF937 family)
MSGIDDRNDSAEGGGLGDLLGGLAGGGGVGGSLEGILGTLSGSGGQGPGGLGGLLTALVPAVDGMLAGGGLQSVLARFEATGLGAQAASWVGTGANAPITGADVEKAVEPEQIAGIAAELGVSEQEAAEAVAQVLPAAVDRLTPGGELPEGPATA